MSQRTWSVCAGMALGALSALGCGGSALRPLPTSAEAFPPAELTLVWVGRGACERLESGVWRRRPELDYDFQVVQRRYADHWESIKEMHRRHPDYDGSAGPRDQSYFFRIGLGQVSGEKLPLTLDSTLGPGEGQSDRVFRASDLVIHAEVSSMAPFDTYRITQHYGYEKGELRETVELFDHEDGREVPWVRNQEVATLFAPRSFDAPPTTR